MKYFLLLFSLLIFFAFALCVNKLTKIEIIVYVLYVSNFEGYLCMNGDFSFYLDEEKLKNLFADVGCYIVFKNDSFSFEVTFDCFFTFKNGRINTRE